MLTLEQALAFIAQIGTDDAPSLAELQGSRDAIARELHAIKGKTTDFAALTSLRDAYTAVAAAVTEAETAAAEAASEIDSLLADVPNPDAEVPAEDKAPVDSEEKAKEPVTASALPVMEAVKRLGLSRTPVTTEPVETEEPGMDKTSHTMRLGNQVKNDATWHDLAHAFAEAGASLKTGKERVVQIKTEFASERVLPGDTSGNTALIDSFMAPEAVSAAGGCCVLPTPIYENPIMSSLARPIRDSLPTIGAQARGAMTFFPAICMPTSGVGIWDCDTDALVDPDDPLTWKECTTLACDEPETVQVYGVPVCATVGNFNQRYAPEQWLGYLRGLSALQARVADAELFAQMRAGVSSTHTGFATGSLYVNLLDTVSLATATIRQDQRLTDVQFRVWVPDWIVNAIQDDLRARRVNTGVDPIEYTRAQIVAALANEGVNVTFSPDIDTIEAGGQYDGALTPYPDTASAVLAPEGFFSFLDGGELNLGTEIRDSSLNRQNSLQAFSESFEGLLARGCNAKGLDIPVEVCETVPCPTA